MAARKLRIALPKGRLLNPSIQSFAAAGLSVPDDADLASRRLVFHTSDVEWILVKDGDVPVYVEHGAADAGIAGLDQILEHDADVYQPVRMPFGACRLMLIAAPGAPPLDSPRVEKIATKYPRITRRFLEDRRLHLDVVPLQGSVELAAVLGLTQYIVDLVETGETIRIHGLETVGLVQQISPYLIINRSSYRMDPVRMRDLIDSLAAAERGVTV